MKSGGLSAFLARIDAVELGMCRRLNRSAASIPLCCTFQIASRLGDGVVWYALILTLPLLYGRAAFMPSLTMAITGLCGVLLYKWLKRTFVRERPFMTHVTISRAAAPLDRYSFPSGHTLHAVSFTWQVVANFPELAGVLVPLATLIAASRVVLGLHYPDHGELLDCYAAADVFAFASRTECFRTLRSNDSSLNRCGRTLKNGLSQHGSPPRRALLDRAREPPRRRPRPCLRRRPIATKTA